MITEEQYRLLKRIFIYMEHDTIVQIINSNKEEVDNDKKILEIKDDIMRQIDSLIECDKPFDEASWGYENGVLLKGDDALLVVKFICKYL